jgi:hypothetical protein
MIAPMSKRQFDKLSKHWHSDNPRRYWATLDRKRLGLIELEDAPRWRAVVFDFDDEHKFYVPEHYADIWGTEHDASEQLVQMLLSKSETECGCELCTDRIAWEIERRRGCKITERTAFDFEAF